MFGEQTFAQLRTGFSLLQKEKRKKEKTRDTDIIANTKYLLEQVMHRTK